MRYKLIALCSNLLIFVLMARGQYFYSLQLAHDYALTHCLTPNPEYVDMVWFTGDPNSPNQVSQILTNSGMGNCEPIGGSTLDPRSFDRCALNQDRFCEMWRSDCNGSPCRYTIANGGYGCVSNENLMNFAFRGCRCLLFENPRYRRIFAVDWDEAWPPPSHENPTPPGYRPYIQRGDFMVWSYGQAAWFSSDEVSVGSCQLTMGPYSLQNRCGVAPEHNDFSLSYWWTNWGQSHPETWVFRPVGNWTEWAWRLEDSPIEVLEDYIVPNHALLTIDPGVEVVFSPGAALILSEGARLTADGTAQAPITFHSTNDNDLNAAWRGIFSYSDAAETIIDHCQFTNASVAVRGLEGCNTTISNSTFTDCGIGVTTNNGGHVNLTNCTITDSRYYGVVAAGRSSITMTGGGVTGSAQAGIWTAGQARILANGTTFSENGPDMLAQRGLQFGGVRNTYGSMRLLCVTSTQNNGPGLTVLGGFTDLAPNGKNVFLNNREVAGNSRAQVYFCSTVPDLCNGRNLICADDGVSDLIMDCNGNWIVTDVTYNHWCGDPAGRIPGSWTNNENDGDGTVIERCGHVGDILPCDEITPSLDVFNQGWEQENSGQWDAAIQSYDSVMKKWPTSKEAPLCPDRILFCEGMSGKEWQAQRDYFLAVADTTQDVNLKFASRASAAWCLVELDDFEGAREEYLQLMDGADSDYQYQKAALDALLAELSNAPWDSISSVSLPPRGNPSGLDATTSIEQQNDPELRVYAQIEDLLSGSFAPSSREPIPTHYTLYQNYPNPFNPITEIRFDLPENAHVELSIFNTLGQHVATLIDEGRPAGSYQVQWDGSGFASGVYLYQMKAGTFTESKKMVMLK